MRPRVRIRVCVNDGLRCRTAQGLPKRHLGGCVFLQHAGAAAAVCCIAIPQHGSLANGGVALQRGL